MSEDAIKAALRAAGEANKKAGAPTPNGRPALLVAKQPGGRPDPEHVNHVSIVLRRPFCNSAENEKGRWLAAAVTRAAGGGDE